MKLWRRNKPTIKQRIRLVQKEYNAMTLVALDPTLTHLEKTQRITHHALNAERLQNTLFYPED